MAIESRLLWSGAIPVRKVEIVLKDAPNRLIDPDLEAAIDTEWQRQLEVAASRDVDIYDAPAYRVNAYDIINGRVALHLSLIPYRYHAAFKALYEREEVRPGHADRVLIADSIVRTSDAQIVMHRVEKVVESETYLIGGTCSTSRMTITTGADLAAYALDRVDAVTGLAGDEREIGDLVALVQNEIGSVHGIFDVRTTLTAVEMVARFQPGPTSKELVAVPADEMVAWCKATTGYMNVLAGHTFA